MCGIVGFFSKQEPISEEALKRATQSLRHRGPDGQRHWIAPHRRVGLGHARLSIIDLTGGDQPIASQDETLQIAVNGEFYDFERTRRDLERWGYRFRTHSDSEIALHLYSEFGTQCLQHLRGEFAFVLWDERNQILFAARDRFGIKPLYYTVYRDTLYLASEVKALFAAGAPAQWDRESFFQEDSSVLEPDRSLFHNVFQVPPGHFLVASRYGIQIAGYWDFNYPRAGGGVSKLTEGEYIEKLGHVLENAVRIRLRADVPVGCYLSGGLDSSAVLGMAAEQTSEPIQAFTISFDHSAYDEAAFARETAARAGANLQIIPVRQSDFAEHFADAIWHGEMLCRNGQNVAKYLLSKAARDAGYKVVLTGEGSDEIFGGYAHFRRDMLLYNATGLDEKTVHRLLEDLHTNNTVSRGLGLAGGAPQALTSVRRMLGFVPTWIEVATAYSSKSRALYSPEFMAEFAERDAYGVFLNRLEVQRQLAGREPVHQSLYLLSKTTLANYIFRMLGDGVEMANSIEGRLPFLDHHVVELVRDMPVAMKIRGLTEKYVLRQAARPFLTDTVYNREKHPFLAPPSTLKLNGAFQQLIQDTLRDPVRGVLPFYDRAKVIALLDQLPEMNESARRSIDSVLMKILSACVLQERFGLTGG
jgi:asparagine synthase (glutamine-hydrolysing)